MTNNKQSMHHTQYDQEVIEQLAFVVTLATTNKGDLRKWKSK